jgi:hypothetical protein
VNDKIIRTINRYLGTVEFVNVTKMAMLLEAVLEQGVAAVKKLPQDQKMCHHLETLEDYNTRTGRNKSKLDWDEVQGRRQRDYDAARAAEYAAWRKAAPQRAALAAWQSAAEAREAYRQWHYRKALHDQSVEMLEVWKAHAPQRAVLQEWVGYAAAREDLRLWRLLNAELRGPEPVVPATAQGNPPKIPEEAIGPEPVVSPDPGRPPEVQESLLGPPPEVPPEGQGPEPVVRPAKDVRKSKPKWLVDRGV